jgi:(p)ppGpp synthase/HD superfamily hydrolase
MGRHGIMSKDIIQFARALDFAARKHVHQRRKGELEEPYINHLAEVTQMLAAATEGHDTEPHRVCRRLQLLRDWSYDKADLSEIFIGSARACRTDGA